MVMFRKTSRGLQFLVDEEDLIEMGLFDRVHRGEEVAVRMVIGEQDDQMLRKTRKNHPDAAILRLRQDGKAEGLIVQATYVEHWRFDSDDMADGEEGAMP